MVCTRKSTGKLPPSKLSTLAESDDDEFNDDDSVEEQVKTPPKKRKRTKKDENDNSEAGPSSSAETDISESRRPNRFQRCFTAEWSKAPMQARYADEVFSRRRKSTNARPNKRYSGKLSALLDAPMDIFCEVAGHLHPLDLLHLARTTRSIRNMLLSRSARGIWKMSRDALGMPRCPDDLSEAEYASLLFEKECNACGGTNVQHVHYAMRWRLCKPCARLNVLKGTSIVKEEFSKAIMRNKEIYTLIPNKADGKYAMADPSQQYFFRPDFVDVINKYLSFKDNTEARDEFVSQKQEQRRMIIASAKGIKKYLNERINEKKLEHSVIASQREKAVEEKLKELGYTDADIHFQGFWDSDSDKWESYVRQGRELTPLIWKTIRPKLEAIIQRRKERATQAVINTRYQARKAELRQFYDAFILNLTSEDRLFIPNFEVICEAPDVKALIEKDEGQQVITEEEWMTLLPILRDGLFEEYKEKRQSILLECVLTARSSLASDNIDVEEKYDLLKRADTFFRCSRCSGTEHRTMYFPNAVSHFHDYVYVPPWSSIDTRNYLQCDSDVMAFARKLLTQMDISLTTTMAELESRGEVFLCLCCEPTIRKKMSWPKLIQHFSTEQYWYQDMSKRRGWSDSSHDVTLIDDHSSAAQEELVRQEENAIAEQPNVDNADALELPKFQCRHCIKLGYFIWVSRDEAEAHVRKKHNDVELSGIIPM